MTTLDDKLLGEKAQNYCSSSEGEEDEDECKGPVTEPTGGGKVDPEGTSWQGYSRNTGPKGVLRDWELFKEHERQVRVDKEKELVELCKKSSLTCRTEAEDERCQTIEKVESGELDEDLLSDEILKDFIKKRFESLSKGTNPLEFGEVEEINSGEEYLKAVDDLSDKVTVIIHVYDPRSQECAKMNECLRTVSTNHRHVKFCKIRATVAGLSALFAKEGVPALLVYKGGNMIGNFIRLKDDFGSEFYPGDVENFLIENGVLSEEKSLAALMKQKCNFSTSD